VQKWKKIWPNATNDLQGFDAENILPEINNETLQIARELGFTDLEHFDIDEVLASHGTELTNDDLEELVKAEETNETSHDGDKTQRALTTMGMASLIEEGLGILEEEDPNHERFSKIKRVVINSLSCYQEIYEEKKRNKADYSSQVYVQAY
jgi:hypothetical protein